MALTAEQDSRVKALESSVPEVDSFGGPTLRDWVRVSPDRDEELERLERLAAAYQEYSRGLPLAQRKMVFWILDGVSRLGFPMEDIQEMVAEAQHIPRIDECLIAALSLLAANVWPRPDERQFFLDAGRRRPIAGPVSGERLARLELRKGDGGPV